MRIVLEKYQIRVEDVPSWEDGLASRTYVAKLSRDFLRFGVGEVHSKESLLPEAHEGDKDDVDPEEDIGRSEDVVGEDRDGDINEASAAALMFDFEAHEGDSRSELVGNVSTQELTEHEVHARLCRVCVDASFLLLLPSLRECGLITLSYLGRNHTGNSHDDDSAR